MVHISEICLEFFCLLVLLRLLVVSVMFIVLMQNTVCCVLKVLLDTSS